MSLGSAHAGGVKSTWQRIELFDLRTQEVRELVNLGMEADVGVGLSVSPDGQWIIYPQNDVVGSDIILVENFR